MTPPVVPERRRRTDRPHPADRWFKLMAGIAVVVWVVVIAAEVTVAIMNAITGRRLVFEPPHLAIYLASALGFVGFYGLNPKRARDGGDFLIAAAERFSAIIRGAPRRKDDPIVVTPPPDTPVIVTPPTPPANEKGP